MKTYYLEIKKKRGKPEIEKISKERDFEARDAATSLLKKSQNIKEIKVIEVLSNKYSSIITR